MTAMDEQLKESMIEFVQIHNRFRKGLGDVGQ